MRNRIFILFVLVLFSCQKDKLPLSSNTDEIFFVKTENQTLPVRVKGNTASKVFVIYIHGGPGDPGIWEHNTDESTAFLQPHYAAIFFDQPFAGFAQGNNFTTANIGTFTNSLNDVLLATKFRFGDDISFFILGHSWGGFVSAAYLRNPAYQSQVKGWINMSGAHNYRLGDTLVGQKVREVGARQIAQDINKEKWQPMIDWIDNNPPNGKSSRSNDINSCGFDAMNLMNDSTNQGFSMDIGKIILGNYQPWAFSAWITNLITTNTLDLNQIALDNEMSSSLHKITIPVLNIYGKYDFIVPSGMGDDVMKNIGSNWKKMVLMEKSDHNPQISEPIETHKEIRDFVELFR